MDLGIINIFRKADLLSTGYRRSHLRKRIHYNQLKYKGPQVEQFCIFFKAQDTYKVQ